MYKIYKNNEVIEIVTTNIYDALIKCDKLDGDKVVSPKGKTYTHVHKERIPIINN